MSALCAAGVAGFALRRHLSAPLCDEAAAAFCDRLQACGGVARAQLPACVEHHARDCDADLGWRVRRGVRVLDAEAREECLEGMQRASCNAVMAVLNDDEQDIFELTEGCEMDELLRPAARLGEPCQQPGDCVEGTCPYAEPGCHACRPFVTLGAPCGLGFDQCDPRSAHCVERRCAALRAAGAPCESRAECASGVCGSDGGCASASVGGACLDSRDCPASSFCEDGTCRARAATGQARCVGGRCAVLPLSVELGQPCDDFSDCRAGLYCSHTTDGGRCVAQADPGGSCSEFGACPASARCEAGHCQLLGDEGQPCAGPYQCKAELDCVPLVEDAGFGGGARCLAPAKLGGPCTSHRSCRVGFCSDGRCSRWRSPGQACGAAVECASHVCGAAHVGGPAVCEAACS